MSESMTATSDRLPWPEDKDVHVASSQRDRQEADGSDGGDAAGATADRRCNLLRSINDALFYSYMGRVLDKGAYLYRERQRRRKMRARDDKEGSADDDGDRNDGEKEMTMNDLFAAPKAMSATHLRDEFYRLRREQEERTRSSMTQSDEKDEAREGWREQPTRWRQRRARGGGPLSRQRRSKSSKSFMLVLWGLAKPTYIRAGVYQLVAVLAQCAIPILVREILIQIESNPGQSFVRVGLPIAFGLFVVAIVEGVAMERQKYLAFQSGIVLRAAIVNAVYDHILRLTPRGWAGLASGEITNLVAIDSQKLFELTQEGHQSWACPLAMVIVTALLLLELGPTILVGMTSMFLLIPVVQYVVQKMMHIRKKRVAMTDRRIQATTAMLQGIKFTKLNNCEEKFRARVMQARADEIKLLRTELAVLAVTFFLTVTSPVLASALTFITYVLVGDGNVLTASTTFTTLFLFAALRFPINYAGKLMGKAAQGIQASQRFADFFSRETQDDDNDYDASIRGNGTDKRDVFTAATGGNSSVTRNFSRDDHSALIELRNCSFTVGTAFDVAECADNSLASFTVHDINIRVKSSEILCVAGPVAAGKSTLVQGLIGDVSRSVDSSMKIKGGIAYASQTPFILNKTVMDNILFGSPYDKERYEKVLDACCLLQDLDQIGPARDRTEIGERGVTLSGGQKQRVSLARAVYSRPNVAIFDDPLSALDASTGKMVFEKLFKSNDEDLLAEAAIVLVTHAAHFLHLVDKIMIVVDGRAAFLGHYDELSKCKPNDQAEADAINAILSAVREDTSDHGRDTSKGTVGDMSSKKSSKVKAQEGGDLMTAEEREFGLSDWRTWMEWYRYAGGFLFVFAAAVSLGADRFFYVAAEWWLASWTSAVLQPIERFNRTYPPQSDGKNAQYEYIVTYVIILAISFGAALVRSQCIVQGGARSSNQLLKLMTSRILRAPMYYFETTPLGRILNRFTYDCEVLDITLTQNMTMLMTASGWFFTAIILMAVILPWQLISLALILVVYWGLLLHYRKSAVDLQRLDAVCRSPVQAQLAEAIDGASTIRAFHRGPYFSKLFRASLDESSAAMMNFLAAQTWLRVRIQLIGATAVLFSVCFVVSLNDVLQLSPGLAAMLIIWSSNFTICLGFMIQAISESEASMTSVERVLAMLELPQEEDGVGASNAIHLNQDWPSSGKLEFVNVSLRYRPGLPLSLDGLSFTLQPGQRCGVVGFTGAGKSTLTAALFRLVEIEMGQIRLDGVDLSKIPLADVRGRKSGMTIIMQDPVLFAGTLRECLDPFGESTDEEVFDALIAVRVANANSRGQSALGDYVEDGGKNFSVGERQLLCLGRAILAQPRVLVLDEATASVDGETDAFIQRMLRTRFCFKGTTMLTIAHRLHTVIDYDVILAMNKGKAAEFGTPAELLEKNEGLFANLVDSTGKESSTSLRSSVVQ